MLTIVRELVDKREGGAAALASVFKVARDPGEFASRARQVDEARHLRSRSGRLPHFEVLAHMGAHLGRSMAPALRYRGI